MKKAEITAFLSLVFILLVTFTGSVLEATSLQVAKNLRHADAVRAMECIFAEYQKELLEKYDVFALDAGYESGRYSEDMIKKRLEYYGLENTDNQIEGIEFLTDHGATGFLEQVSFYMEHKYGLGLIEKDLDMTNFWEQQQDVVKDFKREDYENIFPEINSEISAEDEPVLQMEKLVKTPLLDLIMPNGKNISEKNMDLGDLASRRNLNKGYGDFSDEKKEINVADRLLFGEYILEHFYSVVNDSGNVINYEIEYILSGKKSDRENLNSVVNQLMAIRFVPNYAFLQQSEKMKMEARAMALTLSAVMAMPEAAEAFTQGILLVWAFGESVIDIRVLIEGKKVPFTKTASSWQLSLAGLVKLGESGDAYDGADNEKGLSYEDYLKMLLFLEKKEDTAMRCLDLIEINMKQIHGLEYFQTDFCVTKMKVESLCRFRRGITYTFPMYFGYQ